MPNWSTTKTVRICIDENASYEFALEVADDATDEAIAELAEARFVEIGVGLCECTVHEREVAAIDGRRL